MSHLYTSYNGSSTSGEVSVRLDGEDTRTALTLPVGVASLDRRSERIKYRRRIYLLGQFSRMLVLDEYGNLRAGGVQAPRSKPTLADAALGAGSEGNMIGYQTFVVKYAGRKIAESNPGQQSATLAAAGTGRLWDNLDWTPADPHVTHARGYALVDGALPALAWERPLAAAGTQVSENVGTAALGETLPVRREVDGRFRLDLYARGVPPYCQFAEVYHDAMYFAGDPAHPERIYYSKLFEPEAVNSTPVLVNGRLDNPWLETTDGAPVTALRRQGDELIAGTYRGIDAIQGYEYADLTIRRVSNYWGILSHWSARRVGPLGSLFFAAPQGPTLYNSGSFRSIGGPIETWWRTNYRANPTLFEQSFGVEDRYWELYKLLIPQVDNTTLWWCVDYNSAEYGMPRWHRDIRTRRDWVAEELQQDGTAPYYELYTGSCDGQVRQENVEDDADDDGDTYLKRLTVQPPHRFMGDQSGDDSHGFVFTDVDVFLKHEVNSATVSVYAGDDDAPNAASAQWSVASPANQVASGQRARVYRTSEHHVLSDTSGKGVTMRVEVDSPLGVEYRGYGVLFREGPQTRAFRS